MEREFLGVSESDGVVETVEMMLEEDAESVVVMRGSEAVGVMTERDVLELLAEGDPTSKTVGDAMRDAALTVDPDATVAEAADKMSARATKRLLVTNGGEPVGVLTEHDVITTTPFGSAADAAATATASAGAANDDEAAVAEDEDAGPIADRDTAYDDQSICEACGGLARDLSQFNGQLLCADCRDL